MWGRGAALVAALVMLSTTAVSGYALADPVAPSASENSPTPSSAPSPDAPESTDSTPGSIEPTDPPQTDPSEPPSPSDEPSDHETSAPPADDPETTDAPPDRVPPSRAGPPQINSPSGSTTNNGQNFYAYVGAGENFDVRIVKASNDAPTTNVPVNVRGPGGFSQTCTITGSSAAGTACDLQNLTSATPGVWRAEVVGPACCGVSVDAYTWTVRVQNGATDIPGRVWTDRHSMTQGGSGINFSIWYRSQQGFDYKVDYRTYQGIVSILSSTAVGAAKINTCESAYRSYVTDNASSTTTAFYVPFTQCGEPYHMFFEAPDPAMPATATGWDGSTVWVDPDIVLPTLADLQFDQTPGNNSRVGQFTVDISDFVGNAKVQIDANNDGDYTDPVDRTVPFAVTDDGQQIIPFDGEDGQGDPLSAFAALHARAIIDQVGEIHFPNWDVETRGGGLEVTALDGPSQGSKTLYWDDTLLPTSGKSCVPTASGRDGTSGVNSTGGVHGWCGTGTDPWGNQRLIDDWTFQVANIQDDVTVPAKATSCVDVFGLQGQSPFNVYAVDTATGAMTSIGQMDAGAAGATNNNGMGISADARYIFTHRIDKVYKFDTQTGTTTSFAGVSGLNATHGAVNPATGIYYYGNVNSSSNGATVYAFDTVSSTPLGQVATISFGRTSPGGNGDWAFDRQGNLYLTAGSATSNDLYVVSQALPTTAGPSVTRDASRLATITTTQAINGIAFGADGFLYPASNATVFRINPTTGVSTGSKSLVPTGQSVDLSSCASPSTITVQKNVVGRAQPTDQFTLTVTGGGIAANNTGTTTGTDTGIQSEDAETAGPLLGLPGTQYTVTEAGAAGTSLAPYATSWQCVDAGAGNAVISQGEGASGSFTMPAATAGIGSAVVCTFTNAPVPQDFGDAPDTFGTTTAAGGPNHTIVGYDAGTHTAPLMLGAKVDDEPNGVPTDGADGDDAAGADDEDGVPANIVVVPGAATTVPVDVTNTSAQAATLAGWIDLDGDGLFESTERATASVPANSGSHSYPLTFPVVEATLANYARFRLFPGSVANPSPTGSVTGGEVEDHVAMVRSPAVCDGSAYDMTSITAGALSRLLKVSADGASITQVADIPYDINAMGFDQRDGFLYGLRRPAANDVFRQLVRVNPVTGVTQILGAITGAPAAGFSALAAMNGDLLYLNLNDTLYTVDVTTRTIVDTQAVSGGWPNPGPADIAFNPLDGQLYGYIFVNGTTGRILKLNPTTGATALTNFTQPATVGAGWGGQWFDGSGRLYGLSNADQELWRVDGVGTSAPTISSVHSPFGPATAGDGASCTPPDLLKDVDPDVVEAGGTVTYTFTATNPTLGPLDDVTITDLMPDDLADRTFVGGSVAVVDEAGAPVTGWTASITDTDRTDDTLTVTGLDIAQGGRVIVSVQVKISDDASGGTVTNQGTLTDLPQVYADARSDFPDTGPIDDPTPLKVLRTLDFGDAPDAFGTTTAAGGASHRIVGYDAGTHTAPLMLGTKIDEESNGAPGNAANGDDSAGIDDEDAVTGPIEFKVGHSTTVPVTVTNNTHQPATLAAWADLNANQVFDAGERVTIGVPADAGTTSRDVTFDAPLPSCQFVRFRLFGGLVADPSPTGPADSGEVEDYPVHVSPDCTADDVPRAINGVAQAWTPDSDVQDFAGNTPVKALNAPDGVGVQLFTGENNVLTLDLGTVVPAGYPVTLHLAQAAAQYNQSVQVTSSADGSSFGGSASYTPTTVTPTYSAFQYVAPPGGVRFVRLRPTATAGNQSAIRVDAVTYGFEYCECKVDPGTSNNFVRDGGFEPFAHCSIQSGNFGAWHVVATNIHIWGQTCNQGWASPEGQNSIDLDGSTRGGIEQTIGGLTPGHRYNLSFYMAFNPAAGASSSSMQVTVGDFDETYTSASSAIVGGFNLVHVEFTADSTSELLRFRSLTGTNDPDLLNGGGVVGFGVVLDDIRITPKDCDEVPTTEDLGDAPATYGTTKAADGPRHTVVGYSPGTNTAPLMLGSKVDVEADGVPTVGASGDDTADIDDEDAVAAPIVKTRDQQTAVTVSATNNTATAATLAGWIDVDGNGAFSTAERVTRSVPANSGTASYSLTLPATNTSTATIARFRLFPGAVADPSPTGAASAGEVEDYPVADSTPIVTCATDPALFNTAYNGTGGKLPAGSRDKNWQVGIGNATGPTSVSSYVPAFVIPPGGRRVGRQPVRQGRLDLLQHERGARRPDRPLLPLPVPDRSQCPARRVRVADGLPGGQLGPRGLDQRHRPEPHPGRTAPDAGGDRLRLCRFQARQPGQDGTQRGVPARRQRDHGAGRERPGIRRVHGADAADPALQRLGRRTEQLRHRLRLRRRQPRRQ